MDRADKKFPAKGQKRMRKRDKQTIHPHEPRLYDVSGLGNPLVDILINVNDDFLEKHRLNKGIMHLIDKERKDYLLEQVKGKELVIEVGGSCPNTIATLALLDTRVALTGKIGKDHYGMIFEEKIREKHITSFIRSEDFDTGICTIFITPDKERTMNTYLGACREYGIDDLSPDMIKNSRYFYFTGYMWDTKNQKEAVSYAIEIAKTNGVKIVFDIADPFAVERHRDDFLLIIEKAADIIFANAQEAFLLHEGSLPSEENIHSASKFLGELCELAVIKNGPRNTYINKTGNIQTVPSFKSIVKDTTGAGDNFAAGFLYGMIKDYPVEECGKIASFVASKTIEKTGAQAPSNIRELVKSIL